MKRIILVALCLGFAVLPAMARDHFSVGIDQDARAEWEAIGDSFEAQTGVAITLRPYAVAAIAQQIVQLSFSRSDELHFVMVPSNWGPSLARYLEDLSSVTGTLTARGAKMVSFSGRTVGVSLPTTSSWFLAVLAWPGNRDLAIDFLVHATTGAAATSSPAATPQASVAALGVTGNKMAASEHNPLLDGALGALLGAAEAVATTMSSQGGPVSTAAQSALSRVASLFGVPFSSAGTVTVVLESRPGRSASTTAAVLAAAGISRAAIETGSTLVKATVSLSQLSILAGGLSGVSFIRPPYVPYPMAVTSEGVAAIHADAYHAAGTDGSGVKIAVIDLGFAGLSAAQARGDLPYSARQNDLTGTGLTTGITHGTAVAEIVHDVAPGAELHLIKIADEVDLDEAVTYCLSQGIDVINHSLGWYNTNFYDGTGTIPDIARRAVSGGILWINAAGNEAQSHWEGVFSDGNSDGTLDQTISLYATAGSDIILFLTWNDWPQASSDYDLYLYGPTSNLVASSTKYQTGTEEPTESLQVTATTTGTYTVRIQGAGSKSLELYSLYQALSPAVASSSILAPANASEVVTVAAINHATYATGPQEPYSSQGPTNDGRTKPDLAAPDRGATGTAPYTTFQGTSGAAPHVAGAAALLLERDPGLTEPALRASLLSQTIAMGSPNLYGEGRLVLQSPTSPNTSPVASFTYTPGSPVAGSSVSFDGRASTDSDGSVVSYAWNFGDGLTGSGATVGHAFSTSGTYSVRLTVTDDDGATDTLTRYVSVSVPANQAPDAQFSVSPSSGTTGTVFTVNAGGSYDPDGSIVSYQWTFGDGSTGSGAVDQHAYASPGTYTVRLTVTDNGGASDTTTRTISVSPLANQAPVAQFSVSPSSGTTGTVFTVNAGGSYDPDGSIVSYQWTFGDGSTGSGAVDQHAYASPGTYTVRLTVTDNGGASDTTTRTISVSPPANQAPVAQFSVSPSGGSPGTVFTVNAGGSYDPDGSIVSYQWTFGDGSTGSGAVDQHAYASSGTFTIRLTVTDNQGASDTTTRSVSVQPAARPDLTIASMSASPTAPLIGQTVTFTITVRNLGSAASGMFRVGLAGSGSATSAYVSQLAAGAQQTLTLLLPLSTSPATYTATADDAYQVTESDESNNNRSITVVAGTPPPVADAGGPYAGAPGSSITFDGSGSSGTITSYMWSFGDGSSAQGMVVNHAYANPGTYPVTLTVYGQGGQQSTDSTQAVVTPAAPPLAVQLSLPKASYIIGESISITFTTNRMAYVYLCDVSPDGRVTLILPNWIERDNPISAGTHVVPGSPMTLRISEPAGTETLYLFAATSPLPQFPTSYGAGFPLLSTDPSTFRNTVLASLQSLPSGEGAYDTLSFQVTEPTPTTGTLRVYSSPSGAQVQLDGVPVGSTPWSDDATPGVRTVRISRSGYQTETRQVVVTAGQTATVNVTLTPTVTNQPPVADFSYSPLGPAEGQTVTFDGSASSDSDGSVASYSWTFGDGSSASGAAVSHAFSSPGSYTVRLAVTDNDGATDSKSRTVNVSDASNVGWVSPVSWESPGGNAGFPESPPSERFEGWIGIAGAFDRDTETNAQGFVRESRWTKYLTLETAEGGLLCDRIRLLATSVGPGGGEFRWDIDVFRDGNWVGIHNDTIVDDEWQQFSFTAGVVTKVRIRVYQNGTRTRYANLYEVDFHDATVP